MDPMGFPNDPAMFVHPMDFGELQLLNVGNGWMAEGCWDDEIDS